MAKDPKSRRLARLVAAKWTFVDRLDGDDTCSPGNPDPAHLDRATRAAFAAFKLNTRYPGHWQFLACVLANVVFGRMKAGAPPSWNMDQLRADVAALMRGRRRKMSDREISKKLADPSGRYKGKTKEALRHKLRETKKQPGR
jgi:hypothetical protein